MINNDITTLAIGDIRGLQPSIFADPKAPVAIQNVIVGLDETEEPALAFLLTKKIKEYINSIDQSTPAGKAQAKKYEELLILTQFMCLVNLKDAEVNELFTEHLVMALLNGIRVLEHVQQYVIGYGDVEIGVDFVGRIIRALSLNQELIGAKFLTLASESTPQAPAVQNWLRHYNETTRSLEGSVALVESSYFNSNEVYSSLSPENRNVLVEVIRLYDFLRYPNEVVSNIAPANILPDKIEPILARKTATKKRKEKSLTQPEISKEVTQAVAAAYQGSPKLATAVAKEESRLTTQSPEKLRGLFYESVQNKNVARTIALFRVMAQKEDLTKFVAEDTKLRTFLAATWGKQYGKSRADEFLQNPNQPKFVKLFIRYILEDRLEMARSDAARIGSQIGNIFVNQGKKEYNKMAYFDVKLEGFEWFED